MRGNIAKLSQHMFGDDGTFPNSRLPLLVYAEAIIEEPVTPEAFEQMFGENGWPAQWRATVFDFHHYHSTAHEALGVAAGEATILFGGPGGRAITVKAGDVVVIPAGVAHKRESASADFMVVGAYPPHQSFDVLRGDEGERPGADERIAELPVPDTDPVSGPGGTLVKVWGVPS